jgi:transposase
LDRNTVLRFARAASVAELLTAHPKRTSVLDDYVEHLQQRWAAGVNDAVALTAEITALGYRGSVKTVRRYLQPLRNTQTTPPRPPAPLTAREMTGWLIRHKLNDWQQVDTEGAPALRSFAAGLCRDLDAVTAWLTLPYSSGPVEGSQPHQDDQTPDVRPRQLRPPAQARSAAT